MRESRARFVPISAAIGLGLIGLALFAQSEPSDDANTPKKKRKSRKKEPPAGELQSGAPPKAQDVPEKKKSRKEEPPAGKPTAAEPPEQKLGDTPAAPWELPTPEEKEKAKPVRKALDKAIAQVDSPKKAEQVADQLETIAGQATAKEVKETTQAERGTQSSPPIQESAKAIQQAAKTGTPVEKASNAIAQTAQEVTAASGREREALAEATQEVLNPEQQGAQTVPGKTEREFLRKAVLKRMKPLDALDAELFLAVNHLPHNRILNGFFYFFTFVFSGGTAWYALMGLSFLINPRQAWGVARRIVVPLAVSSAIVEHPVKSFFRRRRPFISIIHAIVIGKKPGSWSFPSGHSASAFAGAHLLSQEYPAMAPLLYLVASLVAFSRIYLGDHYPGDVVSGSLSGLALSETFRRFISFRK